MNEDKLKQSLTSNCIQVLSVKIKGENAVMRKNVHTIQCRILKNEEKKKRAFNKDN